MRAKYFELGVRLDATPVTLPDGRVIDGNLFRETTHVALYSDTMFPSLADTWRLLNDADAPPRSAGGRPGADLTRNGRGIPSSTGATYSVAAGCSRSRGGMAANIFPCAVWPVEPRKPPVRITGHGRSDVLLIQSLRDPATP